MELRLSKLGYPENLKFPKLYGSALKVSVGGGWVSGWVSGCVLCKPTLVFSIPHSVKLNKKFELQGNL